LHRVLPDYADLLVVLPAIGAEPVVRRVEIKLAVRRGERYAAGGERAGEGGARSNCSRKRGHSGVPQKRPAIEAVVRHAFLPRTVNVDSRTPKYYTRRGETREISLRSPAIFAALHERALFRMLRELVDPPHRRRIDAHAANRRELVLVPGDVDLLRGVLRRHTLLL